MSTRQVLPQDNSHLPPWCDTATDATLDIIVFSKDRACQLDALLRSTGEFFLHPHRIHIVYTTSHADYELGYDLIRRFHKGMNWMNDAGTFGIRLKQLVARIGRGPGRYLMFLVDDMMFTRSFSAEELMKSLDIDEDILAVSLRMGESITYCYVRDAKTTPPDFSKGYRWAWKKASPGYWNYPMSLDGNIYRTSDVVRLIKTINFKSPNLLEAAMERKAIPRPDLVCERTASVINIAANRVQTNYKNRCGNTEAKMLNDAFLKGQAIDIEPFAGQISNSCHVDVELPLIPDRRSRKAPQMLPVKKDGKPYLRLDLREIPTFVLNCAEDIEKRVFMHEQLSELELNFEFIRGQRVDPGWVGVALGHLKILRLSRAKPPFLVLEDDCQFNDRFRHELDIPAEAEALYLGVSGFGLPKPGEIGWGKMNTVQWQAHDAQYLRVMNMLARHAVLYLDDGFCQAVIESQVEALTNRHFPHPGDIGLASLHASHTILSVRESMCRQTTRSVTNIDLPQAFPDNEINSQQGNKNQSLEPGQKRNKNRGPTSCLVSHKYRFVCFPIAKNASSTINTELKRAVYQCERIRSKDLPQAVIRNYFKFTFLRDPVSRTTSAYQEISKRVDENDAKTPARKFFYMGGHSQALCRIY